MMRTQRWQASKTRRGAVMVQVTVCLTVLFGVTAISLDGGVVQAERRHGQGAADAAAMAAACDMFDNFYIDSGTDSAGTARASALATAAQNGYTNDGIDSTVTVNIPPASGPYATRRGYVEVVVQYNQPRMFSKLFGGETLPIKARAVAFGSSVAIDVGILVLDPDDKGALNAQGGGLTLVKGVPVIVNSNHAQAAIAGGGAVMQSDDFYITGGYDTSGGGNFIGDMHLGVYPTPDPLAGIPPPDPNSLTLQSTRKIQYTSGVTNLQPGVYKGGISVSGTGSLNLAPGVYYMDGGGFSFSGQGSLFGEGVMIYNAPGNGNSGGISVTGQGSMILSGPTSGYYQGLTFFQDRNSNVTGNIEGTGGTTKITGTFYFAGALLKVTGNGGVSNLGSQYISRLLELGGNGGIEIDWGPDKVVPGRNIYLVE